METFYLETRTDLHECTGNWIRTFLMHLESTVGPRPANLNSQSIQLHFIYLKCIYLYLLLQYSLAINIQNQPLLSRYSTKAQY